MNTSLLVHDVIAVEIEKPAQGRDTGCWWQTIRLITKSDGNCSGSHEKYCFSGC
jgi:hypothetical protein